MTRSNLTQPALTRHGLVFWCTSSSAVFLASPNDDAPSFRIAVRHRRKR